MLISRYYFTKKEVKNAGVLQGVQKVLKEYKFYIVI